MMDTDLRTLQRPLKDQYRQDPASARITLRVRSRQAAAPVACTVEMAGVAHEAQAHRGVGGPGTAACSGDLLLGAVAACAQVTCQMVATAMRIPVEEIAVEVEGDLDLRGTLGLAKDAQVGFEQLRMHFMVDAPEATPAQLQALAEKTEQYCVVMQTLRRPPDVQMEWATGGPGAI